MENRELVEALLAAWSKGDLAALDALTTSDLTFGGAVPYSMKKADFLELCRATINALPDFSFNPGLVCCEGERVHVQIRITGTHTGVLAAIPGVPPVSPSGRAIDLGDEVLVCVVRGNLISAVALSTAPEGGYIGLYRQVGAGCFARADRPSPSSPPSDRLSLQCSVRAPIGRQALRSRPRHRCPACRAPRP